MDQRSRIKETSNEPRKEGRPPSKPKFDGEEVQIIEVKREPESADIQQKSVKSAGREKSIPSENKSEKAIESAENVLSDKIKCTSAEIESVCDNETTTAVC